MAKLYDEKIKKHLVAIPGDYFNLLKIAATKRRTDVTLLIRELIEAKYPEVLTSPVAVSPPTGVKATSKEPQPGDDDYF